ncbi:flavin reductase [Alsobacter sp. SYSU M60028]|uniref:Flavin reductase n=1 Tax=Alsobacter ponti TaxID=2962936 RepID=A0ABT1LER5_9HYPH|nr:flavin reductase [Alsobacter ponti]MCP8939989.1 flavin reductase [Alsobacter ponti]
MTVDATEFRAAMSRLGASVSLITTDGPAGRGGMTASSVCSVTDQPPTLLVCINRNASTYRAVRRNLAVCVNILAPRHVDLSRRFSTAQLSAEQKWSGVEWKTLATGAPALADAAVSLDCRVSMVKHMGTHGVFFCEVVDVSFSATTEGLIYFDRAYHPITGWAGQAVAEY